MKKLTFGIDSKLLSKDKYKYQIVFLRELVLKNAKVIINYKDTKDSIFSILDTDVDIDFLSLSSNFDEIDVLLVDPESKFDKVKESTIVCFLNSIVEDLTIEEFIKNSTELKPDVILSELLPDEIHLTEQSSLDFYKKSFFYCPTFTNLKAKNIDRSIRRNSLIIEGNLSTQEKIAVNSIADKTSSAKISCHELMCNDVPDTLIYLNKFEKILVWSHDPRDNSFFSSLMNFLEIDHRICINNLSPVRIFWNKSINLEDCLKSKSESFRNWVMSQLNWLLQKSPTEQKNKRNLSMLVHELSTTLVAFEEFCSQLIYSKKQTNMPKPFKESLTTPIYNIIQFLFSSNHERYKTFSITSKNSSSQFPSKHNQSWIHNHESSKTILLLNEYAAFHHNQKVNDVVGLVNLTLMTNPGFLFSRLLNYALPKLFTDQILGENPKSIPSCYLKLIELDLSKSDNNIIFEPVVLAYHHYLVSGDDQSASNLFSRVAASKSVPVSVLPVFLYFRVINNFPKVDSYYLQEFPSELLNCMRRERLLCLVMVFFYYGLKKQGEDALSIFEKRYPRPFKRDLLNTDSDKGEIDKVLNEYLMLSFIHIGKQDLQGANKFLTQAINEYPNNKSYYTKVFNMIQEIDSW